MQPQLDRQADFWNARAAHYPGAEVPDHRERMLGRLARIPEEARPRPGQNILEIGAGTGVFSVYAAGLGAKVTALDISPRMLERLQAHPLGGQVATACVDWRSVDPDEFGWRATFDSAWAHMVPSFRDEQDFLRMEACSRGWCVFVGWGRERWDPWLQAAFAAYGVPWEVPPGAPLACDLLRRLGREVEPVYMAETWRRSRSCDAAVNDAVDHLSVRGVVADRDLLARLAAERSQDGWMDDAAEVEIGIMAWHGGKPIPGARR